MGGHPSSMQNQKLYAGTSKCCKLSFQCVDPDCKLEHYVNNKLIIPEQFRNDIAKENINSPLTLELLNSLLKDQTKLRTLIENIQETADDAYRKSVIG